MDSTGGHLAQFPLNDCSPHSGETQRSLQARSHSPGSTGPDRFLKGLSRIAANGSPPVVALSRGEDVT